MIYVADAIMGTGKTSATITYFNEHPDQKYIFTTPYLDEAARIKEGCPDLNFRSPIFGIKKYGFTKNGHTAELIKDGENITTTHQAFKGYTEEMLSDIREKGYTLVIDENVDVLENFDMTYGDFETALDAGMIRENEDGFFVQTEKEYTGGFYSAMFKMMQSRNLICVRSGSKAALYYWTLPKELITSFKDVYVLTYLFEGQSLHHFFQMYDMEWKRIGIHKTDDGRFRFGDYPGYVPEYVRHLRDKIHILDNDKMNDVGKHKFALSMSWYQRQTKGVERLRLNVYNYFNNICRGVDPENKLWGTYKSGKGNVQGKGYTKRYLIFNQKATNAYRNCTHLAYLSNIFLDVGLKNFYTLNGVTPSDDLFALSIMVQWIWRSAIRDGNDIHLYIPSKRMRTLLTDWMDSLAEGGAANA